MRGALLAVLLLAPAAPAAAAAFDFLTQDPSPRGAALGGALVADPVDGHAAAYNPAALGRPGLQQASFAHAEHYAGTHVDAFGGALASGFGTTLRRFDSGRVARTSAADPDGTSLGDARLTETALQFAYGREALPGTRLGAGASWLSRDADGTKASAAAFDLGGLWTVPRVEGLTLGAAARRLGGTLRGESLPRTLAFGAAYRLKRESGAAVLLLEGADEAGAGTRASVGVELAAAEGAALRVGWRSDLETGLSVGAGWRGKNLGLDYALLPLGALGASHRVGLSYAWGPGERK